MEQQAEHVAVRSAVGDASKEVVAGAIMQGEPVALPVLSALRGLLACGRRVVRLAATRRIHQPRHNVGRGIRFADGTCATVSRETVVDVTSVVEPVLLVVCFRLRHVRRPWAHAVFRAESELNTILFAGFPGLVSKLWLRHDEHHRYRGVYQWDGAERAVSYVRTLWWVLRLVSDRDSIRYAVISGVVRDDALTDPRTLHVVGGLSADWWRPVSDHATTGKPRLD